MKTLFKVETNASVIFVSYDAEEKLARVLDSEETNGGLDIREVEDIEDFVGVNDTPDSSVIVDTITVDF